MINQHLKSKDIKTEKEVRRDNKSNQISSILKYLARNKELSSK
jgi:hypothetical protein